jgi:serine/threonine-protein kinase
MDEDLDPTESKRPIAIGKYQIFASLGRGGMADVYLAVARGPMGFNKLAVIKRLRDDHAADPALATMLLDEARLAARLSHPNVVHTYEVGEDRGGYFIAMEYLEGQPLVRITRALDKGGGGRLDPLMSARIVADALSGLHYAHELKDYDGTSLGIIHRDVSPHNIFVTYDGAVKLMDFGIAKAASSVTQTEVGVLKGKLAYMAPEHAMGMAVDRRADLFAMGIVLWELVTGKRLFQGNAAVATLHKLSQKQPRASEKVPGLPAKLDAVIARALEKNPDDRFQTAQEMGKELEEFLAASGGGPRRDDVARRIGELFEETRQNIHRQIQIHMAQVSVATSTGELAALTRDALKQAAEPTPSGQNLLSLESPESGSELIPAANPPSLPAEKPTKRRGGRLFLVGLAVALLTVALFVIRSCASRPMDTVAVSAPPPSARAASPSPTSRTAPEPTAAPAAPPPAANEAPANVPTQTATPARTSPPPRHDHPATPVRAAPPAAPPRTAAAASPAAAPETGTGYLTLDTYPWTRVSENGRALGVTPLVHVALPAGTHLLTLENPDQGLKQQYSVTLKADETVSRRLGLK